MTNPENTTAPAAPKARVNRWLAIALTASVALNLLGLGWGATRYYKHREIARAPFAQIEGRFAKHLPENAARAFRTELDKTRQAVGPLAFGEVRREMAGALAAEPFESAALRAAMDKQRSRMEVFQTGMQNALLAGAEAMTPEERKRYAEKLSRLGRHFEGKWGERERR